MLVLLLIISIIVFIMFVKLENKNVDNTDFFMSIVSLIIIIIIIGFIVFQTISLVSLKPIDDKILMYQEENLKIETQMEELVTQYMKYESDTFKEIKQESAITLVSLYPELKSDKLIEKQLEIYAENNNKIKELKEKKLNEKIYKWWIYFGG